MTTDPWWRQPAEEMTREELIARLQTVCAVNGIIKCEMKSLLAENAALYAALAAARLKAPPA